MPKWLKIILVAVLLTIVAQVIHTAGAMAGMKYYMDPQYFQVWSKVMMPGAGPPPLSFIYLGIAFGFITWFLFVMVYSILKSAVPGNGALAKGSMYGFLVFLLAGGPGALSMYLLINLPLGLIVMWTVEGLIIDILNGVIVTATIK